LISKIDQPLLLVTSPGREQETITRLSRVGYDHTIGYLDGGFAAWRAEGRAVDTVKTISSHAFEERYAHDAPWIIDVRKKSEYDSQHVIGAINVPLDTLQGNIGDIPKNKPFIMYCAGGYRSMIAASILKARGLENFTVVDGGMDTIRTTRVPLTMHKRPVTML
jgi:hydroxyacylglutathione hydrolase